MATSLSLSDTTENHNTQIFTQIAAVENKIGQICQQIQLSGGGAACPGKPDSFSCNRSDESLV